MRPIPVLTAGSLRRLVCRTLLALALIGSVACGSSEPSGWSAEAAAAALALFDVADDPDAAEDRFLEMFAGKRDAGGRAELFDSLSALPEASNLRVIGVELLEGLDRAVVDLEGDLAGGGTARFSVQLSGTETQAWRITWFVGPGVEWPRSRRRRDQGLSSSPAG